VTVQVSDYSNNIEKVQDPTAKYEITFKNQGTNC